MQKRASYPRQMADQRRSAALRRLAGTFALLAAPFVVQAIVGHSLPLWLYCLFFAGSRYCYLEFKERWSSGHRAAVGADGEDEIAQLLEALPSAWRVSRNVQMDKVGDVDFVVVSPVGQTFAVDVKAHAATVVFADNQLQRARGESSSPFEKDFLWQAMQQALTLRTVSNVPFVVPVTVFTRARLLLTDRKLRGVTVLTKDELLPFLMNELNVEQDASAPAR